MKDATQPAGFSSLQNIHVPSHWPAQGELLNWCHAVGPGEAALLVIIGVIFLLFGINLFKFLVMLNMGLIGAVLGGAIGAKNGSEVPGAIVGAAIGAAVTIPFLKYAVALIGGLFGLVVGAGLWRITTLPTDMFWAGGLCGCLLFGLLSFVLFKVCVMTYTSLQGAGMIVVGTLGLILKYPSMGTSLTHTLAIKPFILPLAIFIPTLLGLIYQHSGPTPQSAKPSGASTKK
jgi:hypothetical protein